MKIIAEYILVHDRNIELLLFCDRNKYFYDKNIYAILSTISQNIMVSQVKVEFFLNNKSRHY